jgi:hypothetical protein
VQDYFKRRRFEVFHFWVIMDEVYQILFADGSEPTGEPSNEDRKRPGAGLGLAVILATVFWAGVVAVVVLV